jgi:hypothetical protein
VDNLFSNKNPFKKQISKFIRLFGSTLYWWESIWILFGGAK